MPEFYQATPDLSLVLGLSPIPLRVAMVINAKLLNVYGIEMDYRKAKQLRDWLTQALNEREAVQTTESK